MMKAALGPPSAGGIGTPEFEVTQSGGGPNEFVAIQPGGNVGGVWLSKLSVTTIGFQQPKGPHEESAPDRGQPGQHPRANFVRLCVEQSHSRR